MNHTKGPWKVEKRTTRGEFVTTTHIVAKDKSHIAIVAPCDIEANAYLIAAAPEMLETLEYLCAHAITGPSGCEFNKKLGETRLLITKAKGETP